MYVFFTHHRHSSKSQVPLCEYYDVQSKEYQEIADASAYDLVYAHEMQQLYMGHSEQSTMAYFYIPYSLATLDVTDVPTGACTPEELIFPNATSYL